MAIIVQTPAPTKLLTDIKTAIKGGHVQTWLVDPEGDFTHEPEQWRKKAWLNPTVIPGGARVRFARSKKREHDKGHLRRLPWPVY